MQKIPLSNSPNHTFSITLSVNGSNAVFEFFLSYNEVGEYWILRIKDPSTGTVILDSIPLLTDEYPDANFLFQYDYLKIGNAYIVRAAPADTDFPDDTNLGSLFLLVWGDNTEYYTASSVAETIAIIESLLDAGSQYGIIQLEGIPGSPGVSIKGDQGDQGIQGIQGIQGPSGTLPIATAGGTADVITADFDPDIVLTNLMLCAFVASAANATTTPTFSPDGLTARVITKKGGDPLAPGDIPGALAVCILEYNLANTRWELLNPAVEFASAAEILTGTEAAKAIAPDQLLAANIRLPMGHLSGLGLSHDTDTEHDINVTTGKARDATDTVDMVLAAEITKQADAAWAVGTDQGGMDTDSIPASGTLHVWLIKRSDTGVVDALFSISATAPTMPANYDYKRLIGSYRTDASNNILNGDWWGTGINRTFMYDTSILDVSTANPGTNAVTATLSTPGGVSVKAFLNITGATGPLIYVSSLDNVDLAPSETVAPLSQVGHGHLSSGSGFAIVKTNTSSQIRYKIATDVAIYITTLGYEVSL